VRTALEVRAFDCYGGLVITINVPVAQRTKYARTARIGNVRLVPTAQ